VNLPGQGRSDAPNKNGDREVSLLHAAAAAVTVATAILTISSGTVIGNSVPPPGHEKDGRLRALQDCVLFPRARKLGLVVLTANVSNYDILLQLIPAGRALFYRQT